MVKSIPRAVLALGATAAWLMVMAGDAAYRKLLEDAILRVADFSIPGRVPFVGKHPFAFFKRLNASILHWLEDTKLRTEGFIVAQLSAIIDAFAIFVGLPVALAMTLWLAVDAIWNRLESAVSHVDLHSVRRAIEKLVHVATAPLRYEFRGLRAAFNVVRAQAIRAAHAAGHAIANPFPRIKTVERDLSALKKRVRGLEKVGVGIGAAALTWAALRRLKLGWLRCPRLPRTTRALCGMDPELWLSLLAGTAVLTGKISLRQLARELQTPTREAQKALRTIIRELD